jgi:beta-galactosidase
LRERAVAHALLAACLLVPGCRRAETPSAQGPAAERRERTLLADGWRFSRLDPHIAAEARTFDDSSWAKVQVPHTWGAEPLEAGWYRLRFSRAAQNLRGRRVYLCFEGASVYADVYVNGRHLGQHRGAFTRFTVDATPHLVEGENVLAVRTSNHPAIAYDALPSPRGKQLYHLYGGLYRKVWLLETSDVHIDPLDHAASGVYLTPSAVTSASADLEVRTLLRNASREEARVEVQNHLIDPDGREVATFAGEARVPAGGTAEVKTRQRVDKPHLWGPGTPRLYTVRSTVHAAGREVDEVQERTGFRAFVFDGKGFTLNGQPILLRGIGKHQETAAHLSALSDEDLRMDFALLEDLGVNFVRLAHYPHAPLAYDLADEKGLLVWAENGHSNEIKTDETGDRITREMIRQNYNHPGIVIWSVGNEAGYIRVQRYAAVAKQEDPTRLIAYASNIGVRGKARYPSLDLIAQNTYRGWYRGLPWEFEEFAQRMRFVSESGGGAVVTHHTDYAEARHEIDVFEPEEYRQVLEEIHDQVVFRDHPAEIPMFSVWILRDFGVDKFKGRNTKGLVTSGGFKKDAWYLYRAFLRPDKPLVHITSKTRFLRDGRPDNGIKVYANVPAVTLTVNGEPVGGRQNGEYHHTNGRAIANVFYWPVVLRPGRNEVVASAGAGLEDRAILYAGQTPTAPPEGSLVRALRSSNAKNPAWFIDAPVQDHWPFHHAFEGSADNTFETLPEEVRGARWISTRRLSDPAARTALSFELASGAMVYALGSEAPALDVALRGAGFTQTATRGFWWNHDLQRVPYRLWARRAQKGDAIRVPAVTADYVLMVKAP